MNINTPELYNFLEEYDDSINNNSIKKIMYISILKKMLSKNNNIYNKILFLENSIQRPTLKNIIIYFIKVNKEYTKLFFIKNILFSEHLNTLLIERYVTCLCQLLDNNYYYFSKYFYTILKESILELNTKSQNIIIDTELDLDTKFNNEYIFYNLTDFCIMIFDRLERKKYELSLKNNDILEFDNIFKLVIRLLDFGFINYLEELNSRITERDDVILDIIYYESVIFKLKNELENTNRDNIEEKRRILKIKED